MHEHFGPPLENVGPIHPLEPWHFTVIPEINHWVTSVVLALIALESTYKSLSNDISKLQLLFQEAVTLIMRFD